MWSFAAFLTVIAFGAVSAASRATDYGQTVIKEVLPVLGEDGLTPSAALPDFDTKFTGKDSNDLNVYATASYTGGKLFGLDEVSVDGGECSGAVYSFGQESISCRFSFDNLKTTHKLTIVHGDDVVKADIEARVTKTLVDVRFLREPSSRYATVKNFGFKTIGNVLPKFSDLGFLSDKLKLFQDYYSSHVMTECYALMLKSYKDALNKAAGRVKMPI